MAYDGRIMRRAQARFDEDRRRREDDARKRRRQYLPASPACGRSMRSCVPL